MKRSVPHIVIMLGIVSLLTDAATEMIYPLIPVFVGALGSGAVALGVIEGVSESTSSLLKLVGGIISDRIGRRKVFVIIGYSISSLIRPLTGIVSSAWQIVVVRMLDRIGKGLRTAPRDALLASGVDESIRGKSFGFHRAMDHTGAMIGPILAIITLLVLFTGFGISDTTLALRWTFILAIIPGVLAVLTLLILVREPPSAGSDGNNFRFSLKGFDSNFRTYLLILILFTLGNSSDAFLLFRIEESISKSGAVVSIVNSIRPLREIVAGFGSAQDQETVINILFLPLVWSFFHVIKVIFSTPLGSLSDRIGRKKAINAGWAVYSFVYISFALLVFLPSDVQVIATFILFAIYALYYAFTEGAEKALVADMVKEEQRGSAYGLYNFAIGLGALPASIIFGLIYSLADKKLPGFGGTFAFGFGGLLAISSIILLSLKVREPHKKND